MKKLIFFIFFCLITAVKPSLAQSITGNELLEFCDGNQQEKETCLFYIIGVIETKQAMEFWQKSPCYLYYRPEKSTTGQLMDIVIKGLKENPKNRHLSAVLLLFNYMSAAYPCPTK